MDKKSDVQKMVLEQSKIFFASARKSPYFQQGVIIALLAVFILFFFLPIWMQNRKTSAQVSELKRRIETANAKIARIPEMTKQKEEQTSKLQKVRNQFFEAKEIDKLIEIISTAAADTGVRISATRPTYKTVEMPPPFDQIYLSVSYELIVEGPYHNFGSFINALERYPKHFVVSNLEIQNSDKTPDIHKYTLNLTAFLKKG